MATSLGLYKPSSGQNIYKNLNASVYNALTNNTLYTPAFKFLYVFWPDDGLHKPKLVAII